MRTSAAHSPRKAVASFLLGLFFTVTLIAPAAPINKVLFAGIGAWLLIDILLAPAGRVAPIFAPVFVLAIFTYGLALSWVNRSNEALALQFFTSSFVPFLIYFVRRHEIAVDRLVELSALVLLAFTALFWTTTIWPDLFFAESTKALMEEVSLGAVAERDFLETPTLSVHLGTVPFLFIALCLRAVRLFQGYRWRDALLLLALLVGIFLSASRGLIAISILFLLILLIDRVPLIVRLATLLIVAVLLYAATELYLGNSLVLSAEETSNAIKIGHYQSYFDDLTAGSLIAGRGLAAFYFSSGSGAFVAHTEITPLDMARYVGVVLATLLYFVIMFPTLRLKRYGGPNRIWLIAFLLYLALSTTNPVMFNSYGMLVVLWYWSKLIGVSRSATEERPRGQVCAQKAIA